MAIATFPAHAPVEARRPQPGGQVTGTLEDPYRLDTFTLPDGRTAFTWPDTGTTMVFVNEDTIEFLGAT